jgi:hypothetical protein
MNVFLATASYKIYDKFPKNDDIPFIGSPDLDNYAACVPIFYGRINAASEDLWEFADGTDGELMVEILQKLWLALCDPHSNPRIYDPTRLELFELLRQGDLPKNNTIEPNSDFL